jgi:TRAP-type C4-dicarboxylate transport system permease small subunit
MLGSIVAWHGRLLVLFTWLSGLCLLAVSVVTSVDVGVRWVTGRPLLGILEINEVGFVLITFAALGLMLFRDRQMSVDIFTSRFTGVRKRVAKIFDCILGMLFFSILLYTSYHEFIRAYEWGYVRNGILQIPEAIPLSFVFLGSLLSVATLLLQAVVNIVDHNPTIPSSR